MRTLVSRILISTAICATLAGAAVSHAAAGGEQLAPVWATVNVCDSGSDQVGARVGVPGDGSHQQIYARFTVQWFSEERQAWETVEGAPSSPWVYVGSARVTSQQAGWTFQFEQPADGRTKQLRAVAEVQWREGAEVARSSSMVTQAGVQSDVGGSQTTCALS
jgi:hypothetical protein